MEQSCRRILVQKHVPVDTPPIIWRVLELLLQFASKYWASKSEIYLFYVEILDIIIYQWDKAHIAVLFCSMKTVRKCMTKC